MGGGWNIGKGPAATRSFSGLISIRDRIGNGVLPPNGGINLEKYLRICSSFLFFPNGSGGVDSWNGLRKVQEI